MSLLLVLITILIVFRAVLLPFALAIFLSFLLFPLVSRIEHGRISAQDLPEWVPGRRVLSHLPKVQWRLPRWLSVITIYAILITIGWWTLPPMVVSLTSEATQLKDSLPQLFRSVNDWMGNAQRKVARLLEVQEPSQANLNELFNALKQLRTGRLNPPRSGIPLPTTSASGDGADGTSAEQTPAPVAGPQFSFIHIEFVFPDSLGTPRGALRIGNTESPSALETARDSGESSAQSESTDLDVEGSSAGQEPQSQQEEPGALGDPSQAEPPVESELRILAASNAEEQATEHFSLETCNAAFEELKSYLEQSLAEPGPAPKDLPERMAQRVMDINRRSLHLPQSDDGLLSFKELVQSQVGSLIRREEYIDLVDRETQTALATARSWVAEQLKRTTRGVAAVVVGVFDFFLILMLAAFFLVFFPRVVDYVRDLVPPQYRDDYTAIIGRIDTRLSGAIRGQVIICLVNGAITYPGVYWCGRLFDAPVLSNFALLLSLVATVLSLIPIFGVIISTIPMVLLALTQSFWAAIAVIAWVCLIHAIEAYVLNPHILGHSAQMNPIIVMFALLAGKNAGGLIGALLAVPIAAVVVALFGYYRRRMSRVYAAESGQEVPEDRWDD